MTSKNISQVDKSLSNNLINSCSGSKSTSHGVINSDNAGTTNVFKNSIDSSETVTGLTQILHSHAVHLKKTVQCSLNIHHKKDENVNNCQNSCNHQIHSINFHNNTNNNKNDESQHNNHNNTVITIPMNFILPFNTNYMNIKQKAVFDFSQNEIHPAIIRVGLGMEARLIVGSNARTVAMLTAFKHVVQDYSPPPYRSLLSHLKIYFDKQINFITNCRKHNIAMGGVIKWFKRQLSVLSASKEFSELQQKLLADLSSFINERILTAAISIAHMIGEHAIKNGDQIIVYGRSTAVEYAILQAKNLGKQFGVTVIDSYSDPEGQELAKKFQRSGLKVTYSLLSGLSYHMNECTKIILGAAAVSTNAYVINRVGAAIVAMMGYNYAKQVLILCESYKLSDKILLDSCCINELRDLNDVHKKHRFFNLKSNIPDDVTSSNNDSNNNNNLTAVGITDSNCADNFNDYYNSYEYLSAFYSNCFKGIDNRCFSEYFRWNDPSSNSKSTQEYSTTEKITFVDFLINKDLCIYGDNSFFFGGQSKNLVIVNTFCNSWNKSTCNKFIPSNNPCAVHDQFCHLDNVRTVTPSYDVTPSKFINYIVTEDGFFTTTNISQLVLSFKRSPAVSD